MKKILITGVTGFIGSHLARELSAKHEVFGTIRPVVDTVTVAGTLVPTGVIGGTVVGAGAVEVGVGVVVDGPVGGGICSADADRAPTAREMTVAATSAPSTARAP